MKVSETELPGVLVFEPQVFGDSRGYFLETWNEARYAEVGLSAHFVQDNLSYSSQGVLRGLHFQYPCSQAKLVHVLQGEAFDVAVDVRRGSPTFGRWVGILLSAGNKRQIYIPEGFAHGFCVTSKAALFAYKCTAYYDPQVEGAIRWNDSEIGIKWPAKNPKLSEKDRNAPRLRDIALDRLPVLTHER